MSAATPASPLPAPPAAIPLRRLFVIETDGAADALLRVLEPFALQQASLALVEMAPADGALRIRIEADALCDQRADRLRRRLEGLPAVRSVALGWRA